ncbi:MAG: hypothetical protein MZW92_02825 [Comamonadaceae bacterium]|nr:hypothetical protein [Comamonadaceae bacterium]
MWKILVHVVTGIPLTAMTQALSGCIAHNIVLVVSWAAYGLAASVALAEQVLLLDPSDIVFDTPLPVVTVESPDEPLRDESAPADSDEFDSTTDVEDTDARNDGIQSDGLGTTTVGMQHCASGELGSVWIGSVRAPAEQMLLLDQ